MNSLYNSAGRSYYLNVPRTYNKKPTALVVVCHGGGSNAQGVEWESRFSEISEKYGFIVAYPNGTGYFRKLYWNDGRPYADGSPNRTDDVSFIKRMVAEIRSRYNIDTNRVYAAGYSNGGQFTHRLGQQTTIFKKIAVLAGQRGPYDFFPAPYTFLPVMLVTGLRDYFAPYFGGCPDLNTKFDSCIRPFQDCLSDWQIFNSCSYNKIQELLGVDCIKTTWSGAADVVSMVIKEAGHTWAGGRSELAMLGPVYPEILLSEEMWRFFQN
jgi:polyhydroxybutyrate depolymerase